MRIIASFIIAMIFIFGIDDTIDLFRNGLNFHGIPFLFSSVLMICLYFIYRIDTAKKRSFKATNQKER